MGVVRKRLRVGMYALHDRILKPRARSAKDTPWAPEAITVEWLNDTVARPSRRGTSTGCSEGQAVELGWVRGPPRAGERLPPLP